MRLFPHGEPIRVQPDADSAPKVFIWAGEVHRITSIEDVREPKLEWWAVTGEVHRVYYLVVTHQGLICELYRDVAADTWHLARVYD